EGIYSADVILVPLEDGDRCEALKKMGKKVIAIDLNPLSRTARCADVTIVDNVIRAIPNLISFVKDFKRKENERKDLLKEVSVWDNHKMLNRVLHFIKERLVEYY
ncbi:MAG: phosphopantothenate/pantothenate synthetase family protein, partial [Candidatus Thermoplasmatota archaeon]